MANLVVVNSARDWPLDLPDVTVVEARDYLTDPQYTDLRAAKVFNLCRSFRYQSIGYYVSLLAAARGHKPIPSASTMQDIKTQAIVRVASEELDDLIQKSLAPIQSREFVLSIYFGRNLARRHDPLAQHVFKLFQAPLLRAVFSFDDDTKQWQLTTINAISAAEIPAEHHPFLSEVATEFFKGKRHNVRRRPATRFDMAILYNPNDEMAPSDEKAIRKFERAAENLGMSVEIIDKDDYGRLTQFDALFIRETTNVNHHTYRFARRAAAEGLVVVDDPESILRCTNKVFLAETLQRHRIATPRTVIVHWDNVETVTRRLGLPCILKQPDSSFSQGVVKVETEEEYNSAVERLLAKSELIIAQEYVPTEFDWRVGIFDRHPLYVCKYFMARAHWQIIKRDSTGHFQEGRAEVLPVEYAPEAVIRTALRAAHLMGDGLYGVDLKQNGDKVSVIEVNDNPSIENAVEDRILKDELYNRIMRVMLRRVEERKERGTQL